MARFGGFAREKADVQKARGNTMFFSTFALFVIK